MILDHQQRLMAVMMHIRSDHPFFGTLGLFANFIINEDVPTAATNGKDIWLNPGFISSLDFKSLAGLLVHELLHAALQHCSRRRERDPHLWNIAADIVVNGTVLNSTQYALPAGAIVDSELSSLSVEEVYEQLQQHPNKTPKLTLVDLIPLSSPDPDFEQKQRDLGHYWRTAVSQAIAIARKSGSGFGCQGLGLSREIDELLNPTLGWRELLWQYVVSTPSDYSGFDRRFVWQGLYLDDVVGEKVQVAIAIDTSGSIIDGELTEFVSEIQGMFDAYPFMEGILFYADTQLYGPYEFSCIDEIAKPKGGGGTSFVEFFRAMEKSHREAASVCVYFTDGYGEFPKKTPNFDVIWVISNGGIQSKDIPFGKVVRMGI